MSVRWPSRAGRRGDRRHRDPAGLRLVFPSLLHDWDGFGPIGVAMALLIWCGAVGTGWVLTACAGAVLWERNAPSEMVVDSQIA